MCSIDALATGVRDTKDLLLLVASLEPVFESGEPFEYSDESALLDFPGPWESVVSRNGGT